MRAALLALCILSCASIVRAQESSLSEIFEAANVAASRGDQATAVAGYATLVESGVETKAPKGEGLLCKDALRGGHEELESVR